MCIPRKINFQQLGRYGSRCEQCYRQTAERAFDWLGFNMNLAARYFHQYGRGFGRLAIAIDPSYVSKSGKKTDHIGRFWSGCAAAVNHGPLLRFQKALRYLSPCNTTTKTARADMPGQLLF